MTWVENTNFSNKQLTILCLFWGTWLGIALAVSREFSQTSLFLYLVNDEVTVMCALQTKSLHCNVHVTKEVFLYALII